MDGYWPWIVCAVAMGVLGLGLAGLSLGTESFFRDLTDISRHDAEDQE